MAGLLDGFLELLDVLLRNRVRTVMTALSVAWGIFVLVVLLGLGRGLENNVRWMYRDDAVNSIWVYRGRRTIPYQGHPVGERLRYTNRDHELVEARVDGLEKISSRFYPPIPDSVRWQGKIVAADFRAVHPDHRYLENTLVETGRFLDEADLLEKRKVAVIGVQIVGTLFGDHPPIGEWIDIGGAMFKVVGTFRDVGGVNEESQIYLPITTAQASFAGADRVDQVMFTIDDAHMADAVAIEDEVREMLSRAHGVSPADRRAVRIRNNVEEFVRVQSIFDMLAAFVWLVGAGTVAAGIVGVSNILLVSVKERTQEIGLRKALGATPGSIVRMILAEALLLTGTAGYAGLIAGLLVVEGLRRWVPENDYIRDPDIELSTAVGALVLLVVAGCLGGLVPAWRAATLDPIVALREE
ncbi:MAG: ABC transporter permease [Alphaproteobacteria bacterium]|nr:ABC transporter permease [Alphaproteobacteria bacterium]MCB9690663.1 ABC transporter permease [Alphaproteobacteria bacterium]